MKLTTSLCGLATEALNIQNACNMGGVSNSFAKVVNDVWQIAHANNKGTDWVNNHPVVRLFASKIHGIFILGMKLRSEGML